MRRQIPQAVFAIAERAILLVPQVATVLLVSRLRGSAFFGSYGIVMTWSAIFQLVAQFGATECMAREMAASPERRSSLFSHGLLLAALLAIAAMPLMAGAAWAVGYPPDVTLAIALVSCLLVPANAIAACRAVFLVRGRVEQMLLPGALEALVLLPVSAYWIVSGAGLFPLIGTVVAGRWLAALLCLVLALRAVPLQGPLRTAELAELLLKFVPFGLGAFLIFPNLRFDILILSKLVTATEVGLYLAAVRFFDLLVIPLLAFFMVMLPRATAMLAESGDRRGLERSLAWYFALVLPAGVFVLVFAQPLVVTVYGSAFADSGVLLRLQAITLLILTFDINLGLLAKAAGYQRIDLRFVTVSTCLNLALCIGLIPSYGGLGASLAVLLAVSAGSAMRALFVNRVVPNLGWWRVAGPPLLLSLALGGACVLLADAVPWPALAIVFVAGYAAIAPLVLVTVTADLVRRFRGSQPAG